MEPTKVERFRQRVVRRAQFGFRQRYRQVMPGMLARRNQRSTASILGTAPVTVSLTSHSTRLDTVHLTIESIGRGREKPVRFILWVDDPIRFKNMPEPLRRLERRGLEVRLTENYGPHTKYYPYVISTDRAELPLVTVDDDILYPRWWLARLLRSARSAPADIVVYRGRRVRFDDNGFSDYGDWPLCESTHPSLATFITGVSGAYYPVAALDAFQEKGDRFRELTPKADDIWLSWVALQSGIEVRQVQRLAQHFAVLPGSQDIGLFLDNVNVGRNNEYLQATYAGVDIDRLRSVLRSDSIR